MTPELLFHLGLLVVGALLLGSVACLPLYRWNVARFIRSSLFIKIIWWLPIFLFLIGILYSGLLGAVIVTIFLLGLAIRELNVNHGWSRPVTRWYFIIFVLCLLHLGVWFLMLPQEQAVTSLVAVAIISVFSDVVAFFMGNYTGKHPLPQWLNSRKSWEGVIGQFIGAVLGGFVVSWYLAIPVTPLLAAAVGTASAIGDLMNSAAKRSLSIKDWGTTIPGHGGVMDRLSSLSLAVAVSCWILLAST